MLRLIFFLGLLIVSALSLSWMLAHDGMLTLEWGGYTVEMSPVFMLLVLVLVILCTSMFLMVLRTLINTPERIRQHYQAKTLSRGVEALSRAYLAYHNHAYKEAARYVRKAVHYQMPISLTALFSAELAAKEGKWEEAVTEYRLLAQKPETASVALEALLTHALKVQNYIEAVEILEKLILLKADKKVIALALATLLRQPETCSKAQQILIAFPALAEHSSSGEMMAFLVQYYRAKGKWYKAARLMKQGWKQNPSASLVVDWIESFKDKPAAYKARKLDTLAQGNFISQAHYVALTQAALQEGLRNKAEEYFYKASSLGSNAPAIQWLEMALQAKTAAPLKLLDLAGKLSPDIS